MKLKKIVCTLFKVLLVLVVVVLAYFMYAVVWIYRFNADQKRTVENVDSDFYQTSQLVRDPNGYFGIIATINNQCADTLLIDTQASTSLAKQEVLDRYEAEYWKRKPIPTFNFYKQAYFSKLYRVNEIGIGDCMLKDIVFTSVPKDNGMYNALYRTVLGRTIIENMGWKFDLDKNEMTLFSLANEGLLKRETEGFMLVKNGINDLSLYGEQTDSLQLMFDLGSNYDLLIDKTVYEKLRKQQTPRRYAFFRREELIDTVEEFQGITMYCNGIAIPDCTLDYIPSINKNVAGNIFAGKLNFILVGEDLYIKQRTDIVPTDQAQLSVLGLRLNLRGNAVCVTALEINGLAETAGLMLGDKVIAVDNGAVSIDEMSVSSGKLERYIQQADSLTLEIERNGERKNYMIVHNE